MKLQTAQSWDEMFLRIMQSWVDTSRYLAPLENPDETDFEDCKECQRHYLALLAARNDTTVEKWPHWMVKHLSDLLLQLRIEIQERTLDRPLAASTVRDYFIGSGNIPSYLRGAATKEAIDAICLATQTYYLWVQERLSDLGEWPRRVYQALRPVQEPQSEAHSRH